MKQQRLALSGFKKTTRTDGNEAGQHPGHALIAAWMVDREHGPRQCVLLTLGDMWSGFEAWCLLMGNLLPGDHHVIPNRVSFGRLLASHGIRRLSKVTQGDARVWTYALPVRHA